MELYFLRFYLQTRYSRVKKQVALAKKRERSRLLKKGETAKYTKNRRELSSQIKEDFFN